MSQQANTLRDKSVRFPAAVLPTYLGNLLYSTPDLMSELDKPVFGTVDANDLYGRAFGDIAISDVQKPHRNIVCIVSCRQKDPSGGATDDGLYVNTSAGRKLLKNIAYMSRIVSDEFPAVIALADEIPLRSTLKRSVKSKNRGLKWTKEIKAFLSRESSNTFLFATTGPMDTSPHAALSSSVDRIDRAVADSAQQLVDAGADGLVVGGCGCGESLTDLAIAIRSVKSVTSTASSSSGMKVPVFVQEMNSFQQVFVAIAEGADLIGTELPKLLTSKGLAFTWNITPVDGDKQSYVGHKRAREADEDIPGINVNTYTSAPAARNPAPASKSTSTSTSTSTLTASDDETGGGSKLDNNHRSSSSGGDVTNVSTFSSLIIPPNMTGGEGEEGDDDVDRAHHETPTEYLPAERSGYLVNLWDEKFRKDLTPLLDGCSCHACRSHTRAYVHHLLRAKELLGEVLLYCHNQKQILLLFEAVRTHKERGSYDSWSQSMLQKLTDTTSST